MCGSSFEKISDYIVEYSVPYPCSQPVGIAIDKNDSAWIAATWMGHLIVFDPKKNYFSKFIEIPNWKTKGIFGSMVWGMDFDKFGNLWFTDQVNNAIWRYFVSEKKFEMYKVPTRGAYPAFIEFDSEGNVWFSEIFGKKLGVLYPHLVENNTSKGISEYEFEDLVQHKITSMGPVSISNNTNNKNDIVWFSAVDYPDNGSVMNYNTSSKKFNVFELSKEAGIPISIIEDDRGKIWINDHATSIFFTFDTKTNQIKKYSTSLPSTRITSSLPYFNEYRDGKLWFNEHEGNAIGYFDPENDTMVEYHIPTRSKIWGNTSNPLQFAIDHTGSIYFTEWTENKIGILKSNSIDKIPIFMNISKNVIELNSNKEDKGEIIHISLYNNEMNNSSKTDLPKFKNDDGKVKMFVSSSISKSGQLWNITGNFSNDEFLISEISPNMPYNLSLDIKTTK
ncbi:MAG: Vgb family protein, partial [Nitrososphaeraceae archaeon]